MSSQFGPTGPQTGPPYGQPPMVPPYQPGQQIPQYTPPVPGMRTMRSGCGAGGCTGGCLAVVGVIIIALLGGSWYMMQWAKKNILEETPMTFNAPKLSESEQDALNSKLAPVAKAFHDDTGEIVKLSLTQDELNWILSQEYLNPEAKENIKALLEFPEDDAVAFRISMPLGQGKKGGPGRQARLTSTWREKANFRSRTGK